MAFCPYTGTRSLNIPYIHECQTHAYAQWRVVTFFQPIDQRQEYRVPTHQRCLAPPSYAQHRVTYALPNTALNYGFNSFSSVMIDW